MGNYPNKNYDYSRTGVAMVTLCGAPGLRFITIGPKVILPNKLCAVIQRQFHRIHEIHPEMKVGKYQVMPDHVHFLLHVTRNLPPFSNWLVFIDEFREACRREAKEAGLLPPGIDDFFVGPINHTLIFNSEQLQREYDYIKDNIHRYRVKKAFPDLFRKAAKLSSVKYNRYPLWRFGNGFLLDRPLRVFVQTHRVVTPEEMERLELQARSWIARGAVFVSPFISQPEKRIKDLVVAGGCDLIQITDAEMSPRWKPGGRDFDLCAEGRLLMISAFETLPKSVSTTITRECCLKMNEIGEYLADGRRMDMPMDKVSQSER